MAKIAILLVLLVACGGGKKSADKEKKPEGADIGAKSTTDDSKVENSETTGESGEAENTDSSEEAGGDNTAETNTTASNQTQTTAANSNAQATPTTLPGNTATTNTINKNTDFDKLTNQQIAAAVAKSHASKQQNSRPVLEALAQGFGAFFQFLLRRPSPTAQPTIDEKTLAQALDDDPNLRAEMIDALKESVGVTTTTKTPAVTTTTQPQSIIVPCGYYCWPPYYFP
jgi:hypothetical protein